MRYFGHKNDGQVASLTSERLIHEFLNGERQGSGNIEEPSEWVELSREEYEGIANKTMVWNGVAVVPYVIPKLSREEIETRDKAQYYNLVQHLLEERGYTIDRVQAIVCNSMIENDAKCVEHARELKELEIARQECKTKAHSIVYDKVNKDRQIK